MYMYETSCYFFNHTTQYMIERLKWLTVHTNNESTIWSLYMDIHILSYNYSFDLFEGYTKSCPEVRNKRLYCVLHKDNYEKILPQII